MKRRTFVLGAASSPVAASAGIIPIAEVVTLERAAAKPLTMMSVDGSNMAGFEWRWDFVLERSADGTFSAKATQFDILPEPEDEPWELDPHVSLKNGREVFAALERLADEAWCQVDAEVLERIATRLDDFDPVLAWEFRDEAERFAEEMGWDE